MLKRLLGNWKAHRKRPTLLPGEGDIHFENPSSLNPLYEDSDESASSQKLAETDPKSNLKTSEQPSSFPNEEASSNAQVPDNFTNVEPSVSYTGGVTNDEPAVGSANIQKNAVSELKSETESESFSDKSKNLSTLKDITNLENESFLHKFGSDRKLIKDKIKHEDVKQESGIAGSNITAISIETSADTRTEPNDNLRSIKKQASELVPSTKNGVENNVTAFEQEVPVKSKAAQNDTFSHAAILTNSAKAPNSSPISKPIVKYETRAAKNVVENDITALEHEVPSTSKAEKIETIGHAEKASNSSPKPVPQVKQKLRAIDELIKKFQNSEIFNLENLQKSDLNLSRTNSTHAQQIASKDTNIKIQSYKDSKDKTLVVPKSDVKPHFKLEKESLENIFNFPPPPPIESLKENKPVFNQNHNPEEKLKTGTKLDFFENDEPSRKGGLTKSDSSLERNVAISAHKTGKNITSNERAYLKEQQVLTKSEDVGSQYSQQGGLFTPHSRRENNSLRNEASGLGKESINLQSSSAHSSSVPNFQKETDEVQSTLSVKISNTTTAKGTQHSNDPSHSKTELNTSNVNDSINAKSKSSDLVPKSSTSQKEADLPKSHSEDSGITRGDQISSEMASDLPTEKQVTGELTSPSFLKRSRKQRNSKRNRNNRCNHCKRSHLEDLALKKGQCDDYYDVLTGYHPSHRSRHSDSWTSDLSWEDRELLKRLRRKKGSSGSNATSVRSRHRRRSMRDSPFHRSHRIRRSLSDESSFYGSSGCSCDECWSQKVKHFANSRTSLRGIPPIQEMCTCRSVKPEVLGRRVQFLSETIPELPLLEKISTPSSSGKNDDQDEAPDETNSHISSKSKEDQTKKTQDKLENNQKILEEGYRFLTPWELEEWNLAMRRHSLKRRRSRARCMGLIALALVVFVGLIVTILMLYLRRRIL